MNTMNPYLLYSAQQVRDFDRTAIEEYRISGFTLMQRAAKFALHVILKTYPTVQNILVFCGGGNNGGDGYEIATLALMMGLNVKVCTLIDPILLKDDAKTAYIRYQQTGGMIYELNEFGFEKSDVIVDALLGTGLTREVTGEYENAIHFINAQACPVVAVDIPSGLNANNGCVMGIAVKADLTVSFVAQKQGLFTGDALEYTGKVFFSDLEIPNKVFDNVQSTAQLIHLSPLPKRHRNSHKGHFGHVLIIGGDIGFIGAARLAAQAALRTGAGLVSVATRAFHVPLLNNGCYELMCHGVENAIDLNPLIEKANVIVLGTGLGQETWGREMFNAVINTKLPVVLDADGLNLLAKVPHSHLNWVLTPHPKEAARLLNCETKQINADRFEAVSKLQATYNGVCLLKGAGTLIHDGKDIFVNTTGNPGMATGGMGDVLAGMIGGLIAQGLSLNDAVCRAVYYHGAAADLAVSEHGERGLLASDLFPYIRQLVNEPFERQ